MAVGQAARLAAEMPAQGLKPATVIRIATQLLDELTDKSKLCRRRGIQSALYFDVFMKQLEVRKPEFCTFFSNHVAAAMHRFWAATFPDDYDEFRLPSDWTKRYAGEVEWAMDLADDFLARLVRFCEQHSDYRLLIASSMGQAASNAEVVDSYYSVVDVVKLLGCFGIKPEEVGPAMAMAPDVSAHLLTEHAIVAFSAGRDSLQTAFPSIEIDLDDRGMAHLQLRIPNDLENPLEPPMLGNRRYSLDELGVGLVPNQDRVATTGYHIPEGVLINWRAGNEPRRAVSRTSISSTEVAPALLSAHEITPPDYMARTGLRL